MDGLINGIKEGEKMRKIISIILCVFISVSFISCTKQTISESVNINNDNMKPTQSHSEIKNNNTSSTTKNNNLSENKNNINNKSIKKLYVSYNGINIDVDIDENGISEILELQESAVVPETKLKKAFAYVGIIYDDGTESKLGTIFIGEDGFYYLRFDNCENPNAAYKMTDEGFLNNLL